MNVEASTVVPTSVVVNVSERVANCGGIVTGTGSGLLMVTSEFSYALISYYSGFTDKR